MPLPQVTTSDYPEQARKHLGLAVTRAREAAGWMRRKDLAEQAGISLRSLAKLEGGDPGVGRLVLEAVGRALPHWTEDDPWRVLDGDDPPSPSPDAAEETQPEPEPEEDPWTDEDEKVYDALVKLVGEGRLRLRVVQAIEEEARKRTERNSRNSSDTAS